MSRIAPYKHQNGSPCWTKNCSRNTQHLDLGFIDELKYKYEHSTDVTRQNIIPTSPQVSFDNIYARPSFDEQRYMNEAQLFISELSNEEKEALKDYVISGYQSMNEALYSGKSLTNTIKLVDSALAKYKGDHPDILWRSIIGSTARLYDNTKVGDVIEFKGFTSASETPDALMLIPNDLSIYMNETLSSEWETEGNSYRVKLPKSFSDKSPSNVLFQIKSKRAAPVSEFRSTLAEEEWLIPRGKQFRVIGIHANVAIGNLNHLYNGTRARVIELQEI